ncbi:MAG: cytochrome c [Lentisphaeria bacterium]|nr:cytochrome c [Candidatus Neomarinimicrobiota bacterium]MCF7842365.1 cytochrome c [Lentisphaeria bacterium]
MNIIWKILIGIVSVLIVVILGGLIYLNTAFPDVGPPPEITVEETPEQIARGAYLANHVSVCMDCHSERDWTKFAGPPKAGTWGKGGDVFDEKIGLPGVIYSRNITPVGLGDWTDGEIYHAITTGVRKNGEPLFPIMPYPAYGYMDPRDVKAIIAYLRTLEPLEGEYPDHELNFPLNLIVRTIPEPAQPMTRPDRSDVVAYGEYMMKIAGCTDCHTPVEKGTPIPGKFLAGGTEYHLPGIGIIRSSNLTPDKMTGLGNWTEEMFVEKFKSMATEEAQNIPVEKGAFNTIMPWGMYGGMEESDLRAMYAYLRTIQPIPNQVIKYTPAAELN